MIQKIWYLHCIIKYPSGQLNGNLTLTFMITCKNYKKNDHLRKYLFCNSTFGRYIHRIYQIEPNFHISPSVLFRRTCKFCRQHQHLLRHCSNHLMIWPNSGNDGPGCCSSWGIYSLTTVPDGIFIPLFLFPLNCFGPILM